MRCPNDVSTQITKFNLPLSRLFTAPLIHNGHI